MMYTWALYSLKGGVGKTAAAVNVAWEAAQAGRKVLLWDLDPQGAATWYLKADQARSELAAKVLSGKSPLGRFIRKTDYPGLQVIPADVSYRHIDSLLDQTKKHKKLLRRLLAPFSEDYQLIVLDCPPSMSRLAAAVMQACDLLYPRPCHFAHWRMYVNLQTSRALSAKTCDRSGVDGGSQKTHA